MPKMLKSRKLGTKPKNKTTARLGRNLLLRYRLSKNHRDLLSPAFATSYAKYRALYSFASEKKGSCRTSVGCFCEYGHLFMSFTITIDMTIDMPQKSIFYRLHLELMSIAWYKRSTRA